MWTLASLPSKSSHVISYKHIGGQRTNVYHFCSISQFSQVSKATTTDQGEHLLLFPLTVNQHLLDFNWVDLGFKYSLLTTSIQDQRCHLPVRR